MPLTALTHEILLISFFLNLIPIASAMRVQGNQIGRQRQEAFDYWYKQTEYDWILWIDSDIVVTDDALRKVWSSVDKLTRPVVAGTYFISKQNEQTLMSPFPALFNFTDDYYTIQYLHPLPTDKLVEVDAAGFGFVLMHRSVADRMRAHHGDIPFFNETGIGKQFISEDINFFRRMREAEIPLHAHTGAHVAHMKRFSLDINYYSFFWNAHEKNPRLKA